jgi:hypothetical protein
MGHNGNPTIVERTSSPMCSMDGALPSWGSEAYHPKDQIVGLQVARRSFDVCKTELANSTKWPITPYCNVELANFTKLANSYAN